MATDTVTELEAFHKFLGERLKNGRCKLSVEQSVEAFRAYQRELQTLRQDLAPALEESARGNSAPLDIEQLKAEVREALAEKGITD